MICKNSYLLIPVILYLIAGCASSSRVPAVSEKEAFKYEQKYLAEYEDIKSNYSDQKVVKWLQPENKKLPCKVYVGVSKNDDRTLDDNYRIYWDGECKNGYASGLGREFERGTVLNTEAIAIYEGKQKLPKYFVQTYHLDNKTQEGDINAGYFVETTIANTGFDFDINYEYGFFGSSDKPYMLITTRSPFIDRIVYSKRYANFAYIFFDNSNNEFKETKFNFTMYHKGVTSGYGFSWYKDGTIVSAERDNGIVKRRVILPKSYFEKIIPVANEVKDAGQKAINAQKYALKVKRQYMSNICKDSVYVSFIDNNEYKTICNESEIYADIKKKMDVKLAQIEKEKQQKRAQNNQENLLRAQMIQANAARRQADAAERTNIIKGWENINKNNQMQQLNNNLLFLRMGY